jgi:hypothetical protein
MAGIVASRRLGRGAIVFLGTVFLGSFNVAHSQQPAAKTAKLTLPLSINAVMVALTDRSAEPFWSAAQKKLTSQQDWDEFEYQATQIALSGVVISIPGTGKVDPLWVTQPQWLDFAKRLTDVGMKGVAAAKAKDSASVSSLGDQLVQVCEGCHRAFKPNIPTQGIIMHSEYYKAKE